MLVSVVCLKSLRLTRGRQTRHSLLLACRPRVKRHKKLGFINQRKRERHYISGFRDLLTQLKRTIWFTTKSTVVRRLMASNCINSLPTRGQLSTGQLVRQVMGLLVLEQAEREVIHELNHGPGFRKRKLPPVASATSALVVTISVPRVITKSVDCDDVWSRCG